MTLILVCRPGLSLLLNVYFFVAFLGFRSLPCLPSLAAHACRFHHRRYLNMTFLPTRICYYDDTLLPVGHCRGMPTPTFFVVDNTCLCQPDACCRCVLVTFAPRLFTCRHDALPLTACCLWILALPAALLLPFVTVYGVT